MNYVIILAGGTGSRAGGPLPKQFQMIGGERMFWHSIRTFRTFDPECEIILVVHPRYLSHWNEMFGMEEKSSGLIFRKVAGGKSRIESVKNGLIEIERIVKSSNILNAKYTEEKKLVFIHDAARPYVTVDLIKRGVIIPERGVGAVPAVPLTDSIRRVLKGKSVSADRADFVAVQTPQIFIYEDIKVAYNEIKEEVGLTDDASVAEKAGVRIEIFEGDSKNKKITNPSDLGN